MLIIHVFNLPNSTFREPDFTVLAEAGMSVSLVRQRTRTSGLSSFTSSAGARSCAISCSEFALRFSCNYDIFDYFQN